MSTPFFYAFWMWWRLGRSAPRLLGAAVMLLGPRPFTPTP